MRVLSTLNLVVANLLASCLAYTPSEFIEPNHEQPDFIGMIPPKYWYPWRSWHDNHRVDRLYWKKGMKQAVCVHTRPGFRKPFPFSEKHKFLGPKCYNLAKKGRAERDDVPDGRTAPANLMCGRIEDIYLEDLGNNQLANITYQIDDLMGYLAVYGEYDREECRAECESCFDAMAEFGAESAFCRRKRENWDGEDTFCGMGFVRWPNPPLACPTGPHAFKYGSTQQPGCTDPHLEELMPRWWELGFPSLQATLDAAVQRDGKPMDARLRNNNGDVRVYYAKGYEKTKKDDWWEKVDTFGVGLKDILQHKRPYNHPRL